MCLLPLNPTASMTCFGSRHRGRLCLPLAYMDTAAMIDSDLNRLCTQQGVAAYKLPLCRLHLMWGLLCACFCFWQGRAAMGSSGATRL